MYQFFSPEKVVQLILLKEVKSSLGHKVIKLLKLDQKITFSRYYDISLTPVVELRRLSRFPAKKGRWFASAQYLNGENLVLIVVFVLQSKGP